MIRLKEISPYLALIPFALFQTVLFSQTPSKKSTPEVSESYIVKKGDTLSAILFRNGVGTPPYEYRLYGRHQWLERNMLENPDVQSWNALKPDTQLILLLPQITPAPEPTKVVETPPMEVPHTEVPRSETPTISTPEPEREGAPLAAAETESSPFWGTTGFGHFAARYGYSLSRTDPLLKQIRFFGLMYEFDNSVIGGFRLIWEKAPEVKTVGKTLSASFSWQRIIASYSFSVLPKSTWIAIHAMPKIGRYDFAAKFPRRTSNGGFSSQDIEIAHSLAVGLEADVEFTLWKQGLRFWYGQDFGGAILDRVVKGNNKDSVTSQRYGADLLIKDTPLNFNPGSVKIGYLVFAEYENLNLTGDSTDSDNKSDFHVAIRIPYVGLGLTLTL